MEKREFPMHIRITDKTYVPLWRDGGIGLRLGWMTMVVCSFILLMIFAVILALLVHENPTSLTGVVVMITSIVCMAFLLGVMLRGRHIPEQYGKVVFGEDVYYEFTFIQHAKSTKQRCSYND